MRWWIAGSILALGIVVAVLIPSPPTVCLDAPCVSHRVSWIGIRLGIAGGALALAAIALVLTTVAGRRRSGNPG